MKADKQAKIDRRNEKRGVYKTYKNIVDEEHKDVPNGAPEPEKVEEKVVEKVEEEKVVEKAVKPRRKKPNKKKE